MRFSSPPANDVDVEPEARSFHQPSQSSTKGTQSTEPCRRVETELRIRTASAGYGERQIGAC